MAHNAFKILLSLLIGLMSPLCCCRAMALVGASCEEASTPSRSTSPDAGKACRACCDLGCDTNANGSSHSSQSECPKCPSCKGDPSVTLEGGPKLPSLDGHWTFVATVALVAILELSHPTDTVGPCLPSWLHDPPSIKANRAALRWHCALIV